MNKKLIPANVVNKVDNLAQAALEEGKGNRVYGGGTSGISVGDEYTINGVTFVTQLMPPQGMTSKEWRALTEDEQKEQGVPRSWFAFTTNNGNLAFASVMGEKDMYTEDYWNGVTTKADDFDVTKLFRPSARTADAWTTNGYDNLLDHTIKCVATKEYTPDGQDFQVRVRAWVDLGKKAKA